MISPTVPAQQSLIPFDSEVTSHLGVILGRSRPLRIINGGRQITRGEVASIIIAPAGRSPVCNSATRFRGGIAVTANGTEMPDNNVASAPALIPRLHYGPPGPPVNFDVAIFAERDTGYVKEEDDRQGDSGASLFAEIIRDCSRRDSREW